MSLAYLVWNPDPDLISVFGFPLRYYGLLFASGIIASMQVLRWIFKQEKIPLENLDKLTFYGVVGILVGARLGHCLLYEADYYLSHPLEIILPIMIAPDGSITYTGYQGLASHGGSLGLLIAIVVYARKTNQSLLKTIDMIAIVAALAGGFIRIANFTNSEIIGIATDKPWGVIFKNIDDVPRHPAQLYEAFCYFLIFGILIGIYQWKRGQLNNGFYFGLALVLIFSSRFLIEFLKENQVSFENGMMMNMGQLLSIPYIAFGIVFLIKGLKKKSRQ